MEKSQSSVLQKKGRLIKGTEETKQRMAELRAIKQQKKISVIPANPPLEKPKKRTLKPM